MSDFSQLVLERKHLVRATDAFTAALKSESTGHAELEKFFGAAGRYIVFNMGRLGLQDQRLADLVRIRQDGSDAELITILDALDKRLDRIRALNANLSVALADLAVRSSDGVADFVAAGLQYLDDRKANEAQHTLGKYRDEFVEASDWEFIIAATDEETQAEKRLFEQFESLLPKGLE